MRRHRYSSEVRHSRFSATIAPPIGNLLPLAGIRRLRAIQNITPSISTIAPQKSIACKKNLVGKSLHGILCCPKSNFGCPNGRFPKSRQDATSRCFNMAALMFLSIFRGCTTCSVAPAKSNPSRRRLGKCSFCAASWWSLRLDFWPLLALQFYKLRDRRLQDSELGKFTAHHGNFIAIILPRAAVAVFVKLVGNFLARRY